MTATWKWNAEKFRYDLVTPSGRVIGWVSAELATPEALRYARAKWTGEKS